MRRRATIDKPADEQTSRHTELDRRDHRRPPPTSAQKLRGFELCHVRRMFLINHARNWNPLINQHRLMLGGLCILVPCNSLDAEFAEATLAETNCAATPEPA